MSRQSRRPSTGGRRLNEETGFSHFSVDYDSSSIVVHYDKRWSSENGQIQTKSGQKSIQVLRQYDNPEALVSEIINKVSYIPRDNYNIHQNLLQHVADLYQSGVVGRIGRKGGEFQFPQADIRHVDDYFEQLYEDDVSHKTHAAMCILKLSMEAQNIPILADDFLDKLLPVFARELNQSTGKSSHSFSIAIACCMLCFSFYKSLHKHMADHNCGKAMLHTVDWSQKKFQTLLEDQDRAQSNEDRGRIRVKIVRHCKLVNVCLLALMNLADDYTTESKMVNRGLCRMLTNMLDREESEELVVTVLAFVKKLVIMEICKNACIEADIIPRLHHLVSHQNTFIALLAMRVLYNLSFDDRVLSELVESGLVKILLDKIRLPTFRQVGIRLLYQFTRDYRCKSQFLYSNEALDTLFHLCVQFPEEMVGQDLVALCVNLSTHPACAKVFIESQFFIGIVQRVIKHKDALLCKVLRGCAEHPGSTPEEDSCLLMHDVLSLEPRTFSINLRIN